MLWGSLFFVLLVFVEVWTWRRRRSARRPIALHLRVRGVVADHVPFLSGRGGGVDLSRLRGALERARRDPRVQLLLLEMGEVHCGWGRAEELRAMVAEFANAGKKVVAHLEDPDEKAYFIATSAQEIYLLPTSLLDVRGLAVEMTYMKGGLAALGIEPELQTQGRYKGAAEIFTRDEMSEEIREATLSVMEDLFEEFVNGVSVSRGQTHDAVKATVDQGPLDGRKALEKGWIDGELYLDELAEAMEELMGGACLWTRAEKVGWWRRRWSSCAWFRPKLAVIHAEGMMHSGSGDGQGLSSDHFNRVIAKIREDRSILGVVVRLNTPGGTVSASDAMRRALMRTKLVKPVVVSMADVAASGGYYLSTAADRVFAQPGTLTGSIGIVWGKFNIEKLFEKLGLRTQRLGIGRRSGMHSLTRSYSDEERASLEEFMRGIYQDFVDKVARGRKLSREKAEEAAQGRVWTGKAAMQIGLVDEMGGLDAAIRGLKDLCQLDPESRIRIIHVAARPLWSGLPLRFQKWSLLNQRSWRWDRTS